MIGRLLGTYEVQKRRQASGLGPPLCAGWDSWPLSSSLAHLAVTATAASLGSGLNPSTLLAEPMVSTPVASAAIIAGEHTVVCATGEPLSKKVLKLLRSPAFLELHEFLLAPLLHAAMSNGPSDCKCCNAKEKDKRTPKTVADIYTWLLHFVVAAANFHLAKVGQYMAYANTVLQAYIQSKGDGCRAYDRVFRLKVDWALIDLPLYVRIFTAQVRRGNSCRDCGDLDHLTTACP